MAKILVVDDEVGIRELLSEILSDEGYDVVLAENAAAARNARLAARPDVVLLDIWMPDTDGVTLLKEWSANDLLTMPVIMMSGHGTIDTAVEAVRLGAMDFLEKPIALQKLLAAVRRGLQRQPAVRPRAALSLASFPRSGPLKELRRRLEQIAEKSRVLTLRVSGGSIVELCARCLQTGGAPWFDLAALTQPIDLSALENARGGVLFVEDLANLSRAQQKNLSFALERLEKYDQRAVFGCSRSAEDLAVDGWDPLTLKRLFEVTLAPPSLTELKDEVPEMANQALVQLSESGEVPPRRFATAALNVLRNKAWPGGFNELRAAVRSLALGTLEDEIGAEDVQRLLGRTPSAAASALPLDLPLREARESFERMYFEYHLQLESGNITRLAEKTGLERTHLYRKLKQLGIPLGRRNDG
ncbi:sigma-54-dependent transcriptional regulator [Niveibacterium sp.]|uniref:sigma-54-dependent transcriptional regulator n=1 Tax=Niveibacterium sp. TaxID=2017444 RepID=UPI0035B07115